MNIVAEPGSEWVMGRISVGTHGYGTNRKCRAPGGGLHFKYENMLSHNFKCLKSLLKNTLKCFLNSNIALFSKFPIF